jgi:DNA modification methylase
MLNLYQGDCLDVLRTLPAGSVSCCVTSPPYWGLRDYGVDGQLGLEETPEAFVAQMVAVFAEVRRVLADDGTLWLNLGDSYASGKVGNTNGLDGSTLTTGTRMARRREVEEAKGTAVHRGIPSGLKPKDLVGIPWRVAFALQADGWYLRSDIIWHKPNPMPESVRDRPTRAHEYLFLLTKHERYFYDGDAVREPYSDPTFSRYNSPMQSTGGRNGGRKPGREYKVTYDRIGPNPRGRNRRTVWSLSPGRFKGAHFATFPPALVEPCILAGTSAHGHCTACGAGWVRERAVTKSWREEACEYQQAYGPGSGNRTVRPSCGGMSTSHYETIGWHPSCSCNAPARPGVILDPFAGSGTTGEVALKHGRRFVGIELNGDYLELARERLAPWIKTARAA